MSAELITAIALIIGAIIQGWKTRAEVKKMAAETRGILAELKPNGGASARDSITRTETTIQDVSTTVAELAANSATSDDVREVRSDIRGIRRDVGRLADDLSEERTARSDLDRSAQKTHQDIHDRIDALACKQKGAKE